MAYEWQFSGINTCKRGGPIARPGEGGQSLTPEQTIISKDFKTAFLSYVNGLRLQDKNGKQLTFDDSGNGSFKDLVKACIVASAQIAINSGKDLSMHNRLTITELN